jgi:hypothetical protein
LAPDLVWVRADGRVVLLDMPCTDPQPGAAGQTPPAGDVPEKEALGLLAQVALLALEGRRPTTEELPRSVAAPLPLPVADLLRALVGFERTGLRLRDFQARLAQLQDKPAEVTRARRAGQLALMALLLWFSFGWCLSPVGGIFRFGMALGINNNRIERDQAAIADLDNASLSDYLISSSNPNVLARPALLPTLEADQRLRRRLEDDIDRQQKELDERVRVGGPFYKIGAESQQSAARERVGVNPAWRLSKVSDPVLLRQRAEAQLPPPKEQHVLEVAQATMDYGGFFLGPVLWVLWAFVMLGGFSYQMTAIAIVRSDGQRASRFRIAWRALLVWIPIGGVLLLSFRLDSWYWSLWDTSAAPGWALWTSTVLFWSAWLLLLLYALLALRYPTRSVHDYLAGTYLVPAR